MDSLAEQVNNPGQKVPISDSGASSTTGESQGGQEDQSLDESETGSGGHTTSSDFSLIEDHYSLPEDVMSLTTVEQLEEAEKKCKSMVLETEVMTAERKRLVKRLIELRIRLQDIKDTAEMASADIKLIQGHRFVPRQGRQNSYCDKCTGIILSVLTSSYQCTECQYQCHGKCLNLTERKCASQRVTESPSFISDICPEVGLSSQGHRCAECNAHITFKNSWVEPRVCDYDGKFYCPVCHWNAKAVIPARVLHNWDFEERKVCQANLQFLQLMSRKPILRLQDFNPMLFSFVEELTVVKRFREEILMMKKYLTTCQKAVECKLLRMLADRQHFVESSETYSLQDLIDIDSGALLKFLDRIHSTYWKHIKEDCQVCQGKGFVCELCEVKAVIYPFDEVASSCPQCSTVFHKACIVKKDQCPKCVRKSLRAQQMRREEFGDFELPAI